MDRLLIANRGEIALRVARTAERLGIEPVMVCTEADAGAPHTAFEHVVEVSSYLDVDAVVAAAVEQRVDAVHPGYGFLSENAGFARAVRDAGLVLVGPTPEVIEQMGRKDAAREVAVAAGVPVVPAYDLADDPEAFAYPVLVKAASGGGGKGMRVVRSAAELPDAVAAARREARAAFGDDTMLVETYVEHGRHVEVQVLADEHGTVLHLWHRDCSAQRRHQKVVEEAPAPDLPDGVEETVLGAAVALAREVGYTNAGTVEFLLDTDTGAAYFLEMNTRLQVEHPVTEAVTGLDLVELQLRVADGEPLGLAQEDVRCVGHAMEARVYAEDAWAGFLPQAGTAEIVRWPGGVRVDQALEEGQVVSTSYDPMLAKVVVEGVDREAARRALVAALDQTAVLGLTTNVGFLRELVATDAFRDLAVDTAWLDRTTLPEPSVDLARTVGAWVEAMLVEAVGDDGPFRADGFRLGAVASPTLVRLDRPVRVDRPGGLVDGVQVVEHAAEWHVVRLDVDGEPVWAAVNAQPRGVEVVVHGQRHFFDRADPFRRAATVADGTITAPMPGTVLSVSVSAGDVVEEGQGLGVLEAMKMEVALTAPYAGTVGEVGAAAGEQVALGAVLFVVEPAED